MDDKIIVAIIGAAATVAAALINLVEMPAFPASHLHFNPATVPSTNRACSS